MKICLFSGTSDGREMSKRLAGIGIDVSVYVATEYGGEEQIGRASCRERVSSPV